MSSDPSRRLHEMAFPASYVGCTFAGMQRTKIPDLKNVVAPHPWAFLSSWRDAAGLTQENVSETFGVTNVTIHRWETGKAPVSVENFFLLAKLYGATPGQLMFPPGDADRARALEAAWQIIGDVSEADREAWLAIGRRLADRRGPDAT